MASTETPRTRERPLDTVPPSGATFPMVRRRRMLTEGITSAGIERQRRSGTLTTIRPGLYLTTSSPERVRADQRHRLLIDGLAEELRAGSILSHVSAALLYGLPLWKTPLKRLHVTRETGSGAHRSAWVHVHAVRVPVPVTQRDGLVMTSPARTVIDCARMMSFEQGVMIADAALHRGLVTAAELANEVGECRRMKGIGRARSVVSFADYRAESPGESRSRVVLARSPLPAMELQQEIRDERGILVARTDFAIPELQIAGEFDGAIKYGRLLKPGQQPGDVVFDEKIREDAVRDLGWQMVRWIWPEISTPFVILRRWSDAIARARW